MILIDTLAIEHGLINQMINLMRKELEAMTETNSVRVSSIGVLIDFMSTYANRCHCGKEDTILLQKLLAKSISSDHRKILHSFKKDHMLATSTVKRLRKARDAYLLGDKKALDTIQQCFKLLIAFYPTHMAKEEEMLHIFSLQYLTDEEREDMLEEFWNYDKKLIKEKYKHKKLSKKRISTASKTRSTAQNTKKIRAYC